MKPETVNTKLLTTRYKHTYIVQTEYDESRQPSRTPDTPTNLLNEFRCEASDATHLSW